MMLKTVLYAVVGLFGCAESEQVVAQVETQSISEFRNPFPVAKTDPVVPPAVGPAEDPPPPEKEDPCIKKCEDLEDANHECGSLVASCNRLPTTDNDLCRKKTKACSEADAAQKRASSCKCNG